jgi:hypothetical protein
MKDQKVNLTIADGAAFFAHEMTAHFTPTQFTLDFKCVTPRTDPRTTGSTFLIQHNIVMLDPWHVKSLIEVLSNMVERYEKTYSKIKKPKALDKAEKERKKPAKKSRKSNSANYFG